MPRGRRRGKAAEEVKGRRQPTQGDPSITDGANSAADAYKQCAKVWQPITVDGVEVELIVMPKLVEPGVSVFGKGPSITEFFFVGDAADDEGAKGPLAEWWAETPTLCFGNKDNDALDVADTAVESDYLNDHSISDATPLCMLPDNGGTPPGGSWEDGDVQQRPWVERQAWADTHHDEEDDIWTAKGKQLGTIGLEETVLGDLASLAPDAQNLRQLDELAGRCAMLSKRSQLKFIGAAIAWVGAAETALKRGRGAG